jgi:Na+/H+-dicarboxylate symporter
MSILSRNFIQAHSTTIENIIIPSILVFLISTIVGVIRPASMALGDRKDVLRFYLSSAVILFVSMFFVVGSNNG